MRLIHALPVLVPPDRQIVLWVCGTNRMELVLIYTLFVRRFVILGDSFEELFSEKTDTIVAISTPWARAHRDC